MRRKIFTAAMALFCCEPFAQAPTTLTADAMRADLAYLRDTWIDLDRSFDDIERREFFTVLDEVAARIDTLTRAEFALEVSRAVAVSRNAHTSVEDLGPQSLLPIRVWWFADGLHIVEAHPAHADLLGARVERIGRRTTDEALERLAPFLSGTDEFRRFRSISHLIGIESLAHAGVTDGGSDVMLTLALDGDTRVVTLGPQPADGPPPGGTGVLIPSPRSNPSRWPHVLDRPATVPPSFRGPLRDMTHAWIGANESVLYIRNEGTESADDVRLDDKLLALIAKEVVPKRPANVIVDLRLNTGGNFFLTTLFAQSLPKLAPANGRVFVLIGNTTLSAAIATAMIMKGSGGDKVRFVGERMGDNAQFWAETPVARLPGSGLPIVYSTGFHDWTGDCRANEHCFWGTEVFATPGLSLLPDVEVALSFADYAAGRDSVLEAALALAR